MLVGYMRVFMAQVTRIASGLRHKIASGSRAPKVLA